MKKPKFVESIIICGQRGCIADGVAMETYDGNGHIFESVQWCKDGHVTVFDANNKDRLVFTFGAK